MPPRLGYLCKEAAWWARPRGPSRSSFHALSSAWRQVPRSHGEEFAEILRQRMQEQWKEQVQSPVWPGRPIPRRPVRSRQSMRVGPEVMIPPQQPSTTDQHPRLVLVVIALGGAGLYYVCHLEQVPATGRWRFIDMTAEEEQRMGEQAFQSILQQYRAQILPPYAAAVQQVQRVARRIIRACDKLDMQRSQDAQRTNWTVHVIQDMSQKNAFVLPGGHIFVFTGILPTCQSDAGLATVMSHEIAHQIARHSAEKVAGSKVLFAVAFVLDMMGWDIGLSRILLNLVMSLPNSRKIESEADELGLRIMSQACYDPREAVHFWYVKLLMSRQRMAAGERQESGIAETAKAMLSTHPVNSQRIAKIKEWVRVHNTD